MKQTINLTHELLRNITAKFEDGLLIEFKCDKATFKLNEGWKYKQIPEGHISTAILEAINTASGRLDNRRLLNG